MYHAVRRSDGDAVRNHTHHTHNNNKHSHYSHGHVMHSRSIFDVKKDRFLGPNGEDGQPVVNGTTDPNPQASSRVTNEMSWGWFIFRGLTFVYMASLVILFLLWPSMSLIFLLFIHFFITGGLLSGYFMQVEDEDTQNKWKEMSMTTRLMESLAFHMCPTLKIWSNFSMAHIVILAINYWFLMTMTYQNMPPSTLAISDGMGYRANHMKFGAGGEFKKLYDATIANQSVTNWRPMALASSGYYYAERYVGKFGANGNLCNDQAYNLQKWKCYAIGVRHTLSDKTTVWQPMPTSAYDVDVQFAVSMASTSGADVPAACATSLPVYVQHVSGSGEILDMFKPVPFMEARALNSTVVTQPVSQICPEGGSTGIIGCTTNQMTNLQQYLTSFRGTCADLDGGVREKHDEDGSNVYYASYMRITEDMPTVNMMDGRVANTIIAVQYPSTMTNINDAKPPVLRVSVRSKVDQYTKLFTPLVRIFDGATRNDRTDPFVQQTDKTLVDSRYTPQLQGGLGFTEQKYGYNAPVAALAGVNIPSDYKLENVDGSLSARNTMFLICILIVLHHFTVESTFFSSFPMGLTSFITRAPLVFVGVFMGSWLYVSAQLVHIVASFCRSGYMQYKLKKGSNTSGNMIYPVVMGFFILSYMVLIFVHFILYAPLLGGNAPQTVQFGPYSQEMQNVGWSQATLAVFNPFTYRQSFFFYVFFWLLLVEPIVSFISTFLAVLVMVFNMNSMGVRQAINNRFRRSKEEL